eukprot:TRINITY_DN12143_c0_g1_i1.p1 TRINITY_DN12143_c0_g1~~TRINITY_DN12143_c0_g1_i1.p1  ORF type:complete len:619 (+),score=143.49 TRINITY_DN12143_c0_g1_i1:25-1881(+)
MLGKRKLREDDVAQQDEGETDRRPPPLKVRRRVGEFTHSEVHPVTNIIRNLAPLDIATPKAHALATPPPPPATLNRSAARSGGGGGGSVRSGGGDGGGRIGAAKLRRWEEQGIAVRLPFNADDLPQVREGDEEHDDRDQEQQQPQEVDFRRQYREDEVHNQDHANRERISRRRDRTVGVDAPSNEQVTMRPSYVHLEDQPGREVQDWIWAVFFVVSFVPYVRVFSASPSFHHVWQSFIDRNSEWFQVEDLLVAFLFFYFVVTLFILLARFLADFLVIASVFAAGVGLLVISATTFQLQVEWITVIMALYIAVAMSILPSVFSTIKILKLVFASFLHNFFLLGFSLFYILTISFVCFAIAGECFAFQSENTKSFLKPYCVFHMICVFFTGLTLMEATISASVARWCVLRQTRNLSEAPRNFLFALGCLIRLPLFSLGSLFLSGVFRSIQVVAKMFAENVHEQLRRGGSFTILSRVILKVFEFALTILERLNSFSVVYISINGQSFAGATVSAFNMMSASTIPLLIQDSFASYAVNGFLFAILSGVSLPAFTYLRSIGYLSPNLDERTWVAIASVVNFQLTTILMTSFRTLFVIKHMVTRQGVDLEELDPAIASAIDDLE